MSVIVKKEPASEDESPLVMDVDFLEVVENKIVNNHVNDDTKMNGETTPEASVPIKTEKIENGSKLLINDPDDPDPVIHEIPVFLAKALAQKLFLFQYPVRPCTMPYNSSSVVSAKFKPEQKQVELEFALDTSSGNFNKSKAEQIAVNVDGKSSKKMAIDDSEKELKYPSGVMDKQVLTSTRALDDTKRYAVGILSDQELHMTPVEGVLTIRSSLDHLDLSDKAKRESAKQSEDNVDMDDPDDPGAEDQATDIKPVTVRFAKSGGDAEKYKKLREKTFEFQQNKARQEQWVDLHYHDVRSPVWLDQTQKLFCQRMDEEIPNLQNGAQNYLDAIK